MTDIIAAKSRILPATHADKQQDMLAVIMALRAMPAMSPVKTTRKDEWTESNFGLLLIFVKKKCLSVDV